MPRRTDRALHPIACSEPWGGWLKHIYALVRPRTGRWRTRLPSLDKIADGEKFHTDFLGSTEPSLDGDSEDIKARMKHLCSRTHLTWPSPVRTHSLMTQGQPHKKRIAARARARALLSAFSASQRTCDAFFLFRVPTLVFTRPFLLATRSALRHACTHARTHAHGRSTTNDATCGPPAWLTRTLQDRELRSVRSPLRRAPLLATPIATPLQCGRPERRSGLLVS